VDGGIGVWNALNHPEGEYLLRVSVYNSRHKASDRAWLRFTVSHAPPVVETELALAVAYDAGLATTHTIGDPTVLTFTPDGPLAEGDNVLVVAWSSAEGRMVDAFAHKVYSDPFEVNPARLDLLPAGSNKIQLLLRRDGVVIHKTERVLEVISLVIEDPDTTTETTTDTTADATPDTTTDTTTEDTTTDITTDTTTDEVTADTTEDTTTDATTQTTETSDDIPLSDDTEWTQFEASADTIIYYVSRSDGDNANDGLSPQSPFRTQAKAVRKLRNGYPDWMLLKRGDEFIGGVRGDAYWKKSGRSESEPMVIGAYGDVSMPRPMFKTNGKYFINISHNTLIKHVAFVDLHLYANKRDPGGTQFVDGRSKETGIRWLSPLKDVLFENMLVEYYSFGMVFQAYNNPYDQDGLTIRRCVIRNNYTPYDVGHSSGLFIKKNKNLLIEQNVLDHNGWIEGVDKAKRTKFNHNAYITHCMNIVILDNIVTRGSAFGFKIRSDVTGGSVGVTIRGNFLAENVNTITFNGSKQDGVYQPYSIKDIVITRNVFTRMGGTLGGTDQSFGVELRTVENALVENNIWTDKPWMGASFAVHVERNPHKNVMIQRNIVHGWEAKEILKDTKDYATIQYNLVDVDTKMYVDAPRTIEMYAESVNAYDFASLLDKVIQQRKGNWRDPYTAEAIVGYFREGFDLVPFD
jgi:hypothetical protein